MEVITKCWASGLTDSEWTRNNEIPLSTFYNALGRLRKKPAGYLNGRLSQSLKRMKSYPLTSAAQSPNIKRLHIRQLLWYLP